MNEILAGIKVLKLYAWEIPFMRKILDIREKEIKTIRMNGVLQSIQNFNYACSPILITLCTFTAFTMSDENNILTPQKVFVSMALFNIMRVGLCLFPMALREVIKTYVSVKRITKFLNAEELDPNTIGKSCKCDNNMIEVNEASFTWDHEIKPTLSNLSFVVPKGSLTAIVGKVGSGKSSMLSAILGEMEKVSGTISRKGSVAYVSQQAWIQNLTLRNNVLFGKDLLKSKYKKAIEACALKSDLQILPQGDATEIGENGINLSGGQKQRINLARAVYQDADVYLLDDPLSAVDVHVGKHIFDNVISNNFNSLLSSKTRIWVTNDLSNLSHVDHIIILENGKIVGQGSFEELKQNNSKLNQIIESSKHELPQENTSIEVPITNKQSQEFSEEEFEGLLQDGKLVKEETTETGSVKMSVYLQYFKSIGQKFTFVFYILLAGQSALRLSGNIWLSKWSDHNSEIKDTTNPSDDVTYYLTIYAVIGLSEIMNKLGNDLTYFYKCAGASRLIHKNLLNNVMRSPMKFFDTNPIGRILNRFTSDMDTMDQMIPFELADFSWCLFECTSVIILISVTTPAFIGVIIPLMILYYFIQKIYIASSRQLKRLYSVSKSPIFSHFTETTNGASVIRAYDQQDRFIQESQDRVAQNAQSLFMNFMSNRWLGTRLESIGTFIIFFAALFAMYYKDSLTGGQAGLSITSALMIIG